MLGSFEPPLTSSIEANKPRRKRMTQERFDLTHAIILKETHGKDDFSGMLFEKYAYHTMDELKDVAKMMRVEV